MLKVKRAGDLEDTPDRMATTERKPKRQRIGNKMAMQKIRLHLINQAMNITEDPEIPDRAMDIDGGIKKMRGYTGFPISWDQWTIRERNMHVDTEMRELPHLPQCPTGAN